MSIEEIEKKIGKLSIEQNKVGFAFDEKMLLHKKQDNTHVERPERALVIYGNLIAKGLTEKLIRIESKAIEEELILKTHTEIHNENVKNLKFQEKKTENLKKKKTAQEEENEKSILIPIEENKERDTSENSFRLCYDTYDNFFTPYSASISAGTLLNCAKALQENKVNSAFAIIRPPGHHANSDKCRGFCFYNNVAVTVDYLKENYNTKIAIVDWDVHHGDGTQEIFYTQKNPLFISLHRFDKGNFYPNVSGKSTEIGEAEGKGFNINIPWNTKGLYDSKSGIGDDEYVYAFEKLVIPVLKNYEPEMILISCGFDACENDPLGEMSLSPLGYSYMTKELKKICPKILVALEGGYNLNSLSRASEAVIRTLLDEENPIKNLMIDRYQENAYEENKILEFYKNFKVEEILFSPANYIKKQIQDCMKVNLPYWKFLENSINEIDKEINENKLLRKNEEDSLKEFLKKVSEKYESFSMDAKTFDKEFWENIFNLKVEDLFSIKDKRGRKPKNVEENSNEEENQKKINSFLRINLGQISYPQNLKEKSVKKFIKNSHKNLRTISRLKNFRLEGISSNKDINESRLNWNFTDGIYDTNEKNLEIILQKFFNKNKLDKDLLTKELEKFSGNFQKVFSDVDFYNVDLIINFKKIKQEKNEENEKKENDKKVNRFKKLEVKKNKYEIDLKLNGLKSYSLVGLKENEKNGRNFVTGLNSFINLLKEML